MEKENKILTEILKLLQNQLEQIQNCKSEIRYTENDALLYGKFPIESKKFTVVIHIAPENYVPVTNANAKIESGEDYIQKAVMPSLKLQVSSADKGNCLASENESIRCRFLK